MIAIFLYLKNKKLLYSHCHIYTVSKRKHAAKLLFIFSPNTDRLSNFCYWHTLWKICNNAIIRPPVRSNGKTYKKAVLSQR